MTITTENAARAAGFTQPIRWESSDGFGGDALVKPGTDLEHDFRGFCLEEGEMLDFHGWAIFAETVPTVAFEVYANTLKREKLGFLRFDERGQCLIMINREHASTFASRERARAALRASDGLPDVRFGYDIRG